MVEPSKVEQDNKNAFTVSECEEKFIPESVIKFEPQKD